MTAAIEPQQSTADTVEAATAAVVVVDVVVVVAAAAAAAAASCCCCPGLPSCISLIGNFDFCDC